MSPSFSIAFARSIAALALAWAAAVRALPASPPPDGSRHWAFQPPARVTPPTAPHGARIQNDLDRFIAARLHAAGLQQAPPADPRTLLRRLSLDLTGLPPTAADVVRFTDEYGREGQVAVARWVDRLLSSPHYGERWGRHWLDLARYSDTKGYVYAREERHFVHAPAYRDWVVAAFNQDLPYDRFLLLQIAADQLVPPAAPDLAAMGFVTGGRRFLGVTHDIIDDRIDVVFRSTLALTVSCARCHDHKYDPIPIEDYYSLYGVFHASEDRLVLLGATEDPELQRRRKAYADTWAKRRAEAEKRLRERVTDYLVAQLELHNYPEEGFDQILSADDIIPHSVRRWRDFLHRTRDTRDPVWEVWQAMASAPEPDGPAFANTARLTIAALQDHFRLHPAVAAALTPTPSTRRELAQRYGDLFLRAERDATNATPDPFLKHLAGLLRRPDWPTTLPDSDLVNVEYYVPTRVTEELGKLQGDIDRRAIELGLPAALTLVDKPPGPDPRVFRRGSPSQPGADVPRQFLRLLAGPYRQPFRTGSGRLELARALVDPANPLTARVLVNRVWQHHFGNGLVRTPSDFGLRAEAPSHPELLDWLARSFMESGWSLKSLHRRIVLSAAYQAAFAPAPESDPEHRLLSAFPGRRLDFEQLRDSMLAAAGELDPALGGRPTPLLDSANRRRTLYALVDRQYLPGVFRTFDFANPDLHVAVRHETSVPQQGLFFLNGPFAAERARSLARQTAQLPPDDRVAALHRLVFQREPTPAELAAARRFLREQPASETPAAPRWEELPWRYGTGEVDEAAGRLKSFTPLPHFAGTAWQGAAAFPGGDTGWAQLTAAGGHPGNTRAHACVRRWIAPRDGVVRIQGELVHEPGEGDGVRGFILSSRTGLVGKATVHHGRAAMVAEGVQVRAGDTLDFVVDIGGGLGYDQFLWAPTVSLDAATWDAAKGFAGPAAMPALTPWEQYAHVLLLSNEFAFVD